MTVPSETHSDSPELEPIVARPAPSGWTAVAGFFIIAGFLEGIVRTSPQVSAFDRNLCTLLMTTPIALFAGWMALWQWRVRVIADASGLRWRSLGRWRAARWEEVTDYYERRVPDKSSRRAVVETAAGVLTLISDLTERDALRDCITRRAVAARAREWGERGTRPEDEWPRQFDYPVRQLRRSYRIMAGVLAALGVLLMVMMVPKTLRLAGEIGWPLAAAVLLLISLVMLSLPLVLILTVWPATRESYRRESHTITVDLQGIRWRAAEREVAARWEDVTDYYLGPGPGPVQINNLAVVVTRHGTFDFLHTLREAAQLREIIRRFAVAARVESWRAVENELADSETSRWSSGSPGIGSRVYHYRTRSNRALLWLGAAHCMALLISIWTGRLRAGEVDRWFNLSFGALFTLAFLWLAWRYRSAAILVDAQGITQRTWNGTRQLKWTEVEEFWTSGAHLFRFANVAGGARRIRFWLEIADLEELKQEVATRAVNALKPGWTNRELE